MVMDVGKRCFIGLYQTSDDFVAVRPGIVQEKDVLILRLKLCVAKENREKENTECTGFASDDDRISP